MTNWNDLERVGTGKFIHLTTTGRRSGKQHTVELWFALGNGKVFLSHEGKETDWMMNIKSNGEVTFEIGGRNFNGRAHYVDEEEEAWAGKVALYEKYYGKAAREVIEDWFSLSRLIAIEPS